MTFKKGQSGNPGGRRREALITDALVLELKRDGLDNEGAAVRARRIVGKIVEAAELGSFDAANWITHRLEGKAVQPIEAETVSRVELSFPAAQPVDDDDGVEE